MSAKRKSAEFVEQFTEDIKQKAQKLNAAGQRIPADQEFVFVPVKDWSFLQTDKNVYPDEVYFACVHYTFQQTGIGLFKRRQLADGTFDYTVAGISLYFPNSNAQYRQIYSDEQAIKSGAFQESRVVVAERRAERAEIIAHDDRFIEKLLIWIQKRDAQGREIFYTAFIDDEKKAKIERDQYTGDLIKPLLRLALTNAAEVYRRTFNPQPQDGTVVRTETYEAPSKFFTYEELGFQTYAEIDKNIPHIMYYNDDVGLTNSLQIGASAHNLVSAENELWDLNTAFAVATVYYQRVTAIDPEELELLKFRDTYASDVNQKLQLLREHEYYKIVSPNESHTKKLRFVVAKAVMDDTRELGLEDVLDLHLIELRITNNITYSIKSKMNAEKVMIFLIFTAFLKFLHESKIAPENASLEDHFIRTDSKYENLEAFYNLGFTQIVQVNEKYNTFYLQSAQYVQMANLLATQRPITKEKIVDLIVNQIKLNTPSENELRNMINAVKFK